MENTMGNDMDSTNPTTGFSFINDSLFIDDSSLVFDAYFRTYLLLAEAGSKVFDFLTSAAVAAYLSALRYVPVSKLPAHILSTPNCPARSYNRVGGISLNLRNSDLSHHRAYRSVHGGSINLTSNTPFGVVI